MIDQANKLRQLVVNNESIETTKQHHIKIFSIVSGKGGVGKTNFTINLALALKQMGKRVLILDADIGMSNANILMGVTVKYHLFNALNGEIALRDVIVKSDDGIDLISGGSDLFYLESLDQEKQKSVIESLSEFADYDILLIDNGAGLSKQSLTFTILADEIILLTTPEPTAITDAYRVLKAISVYNLKKKVKVVINQVHDLSSGDDAFNKLLKTSEHFLAIELESIGYIFNDIRVNKAIMEQSPVVTKYPNSMASTNIIQICENILGDNDYSYNISSIKQFRNRLIRLFG